MLTIVFFVVVIIYLLRESGIIKSGSKSMMLPEVVTDFASLKITSGIIWVLAGAFSILGTICVGIGVSMVFRPMFIVKYLFPVSSVAWLIVGVCVSKLKLKQPVALCLIALVLLSGIPQYYSTYTSERNANEVLVATLSTISEQMQDGDQILTDGDHIDWTISDVYYPEVKHQLLHASIYGELDKNLTYWVILEEEMSDEIRASFAEAGFTCERIVEEGKFGTRTVWVYKVYGNEK